MSTFQLFDNNETVGTTLQNVSARDTGIGHSHSSIQDTLIRKGTHSGPRWEKEAQKRYSMTFILKEHLVSGERKENEG